VSIIRNTVWIIALQLGFILFGNLGGKVAFAAEKPLKVTDLSCAERVAVSSFKEKTRGKIKNYSWRFLFQDEQGWVFTFDNLDVIPGPGTDYFITIKKTGESIVEHGK